MKGGSDRKMKVVRGHKAELILETRLVQGPEPRRPHLALVCDCRAEFTKHTSCAAFSACLAGISRFDSNSRQSKRALSPSIASQVCSNAGGFKAKRAKRRDTNTMTTLQATQH